MPAQFAATQRASPPAHPLLRLTPWALILLLAGLNLLFIGRVGPVDDAYITYRVARNLAGGQGLVYNPGEQVLSITTPGYALLLAAASAFSQDFVALGSALSAVALVAIGALLLSLSRTTGRAPDWPTAIIAIALTLTFHQLSAALGMETPLYVAALLAVFAAYDRALRDESAHQRWLTWSAVAAAAAFLLRPDGALAGIVVGLHWLGTGWKRRRRLAGAHWFIPWRAPALALLLTLPWVIFAWAYYGSPLPNTLAAKVAQGLSNQALNWGPQLWELAGDWAATHPAATALLAVGLLAALRRDRFGRAPMLFWAALYIGAHILLDVRSYFWYYAPLAPLAALLAGDGAQLLRQGLKERLQRAFPNRPARSLAGVATLLLLGLTLYPAALAAIDLAQTPMPRRREPAYQQTAQALRESCTDDQPVGVWEIGVIGYLSDCRLVDFSGLLQPDVASLRVDALGRITWAIKRYLPSLVVLSGGVGYPHEIADAPWFRRRYEPVNIVQVTGYRSVIYRRWPAPTEQQDLSGAIWQPRRGLIAAEPAQPVTTTLAFAIGASPAITLHAFLPPGSRLMAAANGEPLAELAGRQATWLDYPLPPLAAAAGPLALTLSGRASEQPAAVAWLESNALPTVHYFALMEDAGAFPRPTARLDPGEGQTATLMRPIRQPAVLELMQRDWPDVRLTVHVDGRLIGVVGGFDGWRQERLSLPADVSLAAAFAQRGPAMQIELRNEGQHFARLSYVALVQEAAR